MVGTTSGFTVELAGRRLAITGDESVRSIHSAFASIEPLELGIGGPSLEIVTAPDPAGMMPWREHLFVAMSRNARDAADYYQIPTNRVVELGTQVEI